MDLHENVLLESLIVYLHEWLFKAKVNVNSITIQSRHRSQSILVAIAFGKYSSETVVLFFQVFIFFSQ